MENLLGIQWMDFAAKLKALSPRIHLAVERPAAHPEYPFLTLLGIFFDNKHICSVTFDEYVPYRDQKDDKGILTHRGLKTILTYLLKEEWVPQKNATNDMVKRHQGEYFLAEINPDKIRQVFGVTSTQVIHG